MADNELNTTGVNTESFSFKNAEDLFRQALPGNNADNNSENEQITEVSEPELESENTEITDESANLSPVDKFNQMFEEEKEGEETEENNAPESVDPELSRAASNEQDSQKDIEFIKVKNGEEGRPAKLKIDYTDKKAIKNAYLQASGMRKYQKERDDIKQLISPLETETGKPLAEAIPELLSLSKDFNKLEEAYKQDGAKGVIGLLGGDTAWTEAVDSELQHREYLANLTAEEKYALQAKEREQKHSLELERERTARQQFEQRIQQKEEQAEIQSLEAKLHPAFDRYRFAGKLGDPVAENLYDEAIFSKVKNQLSEYGDIELTQAIIDKEVRTVANSFRKHINAQAEKKLTRTIAKKKQQATKSAQIAAKKGLSGNSDQKDLMKNLMQGNLKGVFKHGLPKL